MKVIFWEDRDKLNQIDWIKKYNKACDGFLNQSIDEISYLYSYFSLSEHESFIREITKKININLKGEGLEIGSGPGILSISVVKIFEGIKKIILLDKVPNIIKTSEKNNF